MVLEVFPVDLEFGLQRLIISDVSCK